jgi:hypothetical protein
MDGWMEREQTPVFFLKARGAQQKQDKKERKETGAPT